MMYISRQIASAKIVKASGFSVHGWLGIGSRTVAASLSKALQGVVK